MIWSVNLIITLSILLCSLLLTLDSAKTSINYTRLRSKFNTKSNCSSLVNLELSITIASVTWIKGLSFLLESIKSRSTKFEEIFSILASIPFDFSSKYLRWARISWEAVINSFNLRAPGIFQLFVYFEFYFQGYWVEFKILRYQWFMN